MSPHDQRYRYRVRQTDVILSPDQPHIVTKAHPMNVYYITPEQTYNQEDYYHQDEDYSDYYDPYEDYRKIIQK